MRTNNAVRSVVLLTAIIGAPLLLTHSALAATATSSSPQVNQLVTFLTNIIEIAATIAGIVASGFFVYGGYVYITSSGNPEHLTRAKHTIIYSFVGLVIVIAAFAISSFVSGQANLAFGS
jgi:hypothetical protein